MQRRLPIYMSFGLLEEEDGKGWNHVVFEKPFGRDLASARLLNDELLALLDESQIYRIDHYLGKETVQNILMLRFANVIFEPLWRAEYIERVEITALGIEALSRGAKQAVFVDHSPQAIKVIKENLEKTGFTSKAQVYQKESEQFFAYCPDRFFVRAFLPHWLDRYDCRGIFDEFTKSISQRGFTCS